MGSYKIENQHGTWECGEWETLAHSPYLEENTHYILREADLTRNGKVVGSIGSRASRKGNEYKYSASFFSDRADFDFVTRTSSLTEARAFAWVVKVLSAKHDGP